MSEDNEHEEIQLCPAAAEADAGNPPPWTMIENGRYQPRRIRGSFRGRELG